MVIDAALSGLLLGLTLIIAIGGQNAFILRQGLMRRHVFAVVMICSVSDALLIAAGVAGLGGYISARPGLMVYVALGGAVFLAFYGGLAFRRMWQNETLTTSNDTNGRLLPTALTCLALTWLNPHVYLDTVVLLGAISAQYDPVGRLAYGIGASAASFAWFFGLGFGARILAPIFARPIAWRILDGTICVVMWAIAARLVWSVS